MKLFEHRIALSVEVDTKELAKELSKLRDLFETISSTTDGQQKEIDRLQRLVTQHDQALTPNLSDTVPIYVDGEVHTRVHTRVQDDQDNSITNRYNIELIEDDKEHNVQTLKLTPKHVKSLSEEKSNDGN